MEIIPKHEMVIYILNGLGPRYITFVTMFNITQGRPSVGALQNQLDNSLRMLLALECANQESIFQANTVKGNASSHSRSYKGSFNKSHG